VLAAALSPVLSPVLSPAEGQNQSDALRPNQSEALPDLPDAGWDGLTTEGHSAKVDLHQPEHGLRTPVSWDKFPLWLNDRRLVAKFQRVYHGVHIFTVGVYVSKKCDKWLAWI